MCIRLKVFNLINFVFVCLFNEEFDVNEGNIYTGAIPPWLRNTGTSNGEHLPKLSFTKCIGPTMEDFQTYLEKERKRKLNPNRVGVNFDHKRAVEKNWLPSFGQVWTSGRRLQSKIKFHKEIKREVQNAYKNQPVKLSIIGNLEQTISKQSLLSSADMNPTFINSNSIPLNNNSFLFSKQTSYKSIISSGQIFSKHVNELTSVHSNETASILHPYFPSSSYVSDQAPVASAQSSHNLDLYMEQNPSHFLDWINYNQVYTQNSPLESTKSTAFDSHNFSSLSSVSPASSHTFQPYIPKVQRKLGFNTRQSISETSLKSLPFIPIKIFGIEDNP